MATAQESTTKRFFDDLLTMEVNVIVKDGMTARKMPSSVEAFNDVAEKYDDFLAKFDRELEEAFDGQTRQSVDPAHEGSGAIWADPGGKDGEWISTEETRHVNALDSLHQNGRHVHLINGENVPSSRINE